MIRSITYPVMLAFGALTFSSTVAAADLEQKESWTALIADRTAGYVGDSLTVLIQEASQASDTAKRSADAELDLGGRVQSGGGAKDDHLGLSGDYSFLAQGQSGRSGHMVARISVVVVEVLPNGDLRVAGKQLLNVNGRKVEINLSGRARRVDISRSNTILSTSLADATIVYGEPGLSEKKEKGNFFKRLFPWGKP